MLLTEQEIADCLGFNTFTSESTKTVFAGVARAIEAKVIEEIKAQGPIAYWDGCYSDPYFGADYDAPGIGKGGIPLYRLPEGD